MGESSFMTLIRISMLLAGTTAIFSMITRRDMLACVKWFASYYVVFYIMFTPKVTVNVIDRTTNNSFVMVANVPLGLGVLASITSTIGDGLTRLVENAFRSPDYLPYNQTGMVMASKMALASRQFRITDPRLHENMNRFMIQCVYWPIMLGHYGMDDLMSASNIWQYISDKAPKSRAFLYDKGEKTREIVICKDAVAPLGKELNEHINSHVEPNGGKKLFSRKAQSGATVDTAASKAELLKYLPMSYKYLLDVSSSATDILQQSVMANAVRDGLLHFNISTNSRTGIANYAATKAQETQRLSQETIGFLAGYWLPIIKNAFEAAMYGCFIFIILLTMFPFGLGVLKNYVYTLCWLQTWAPLYAIINMICSYYAREQSMATTSTGFVLKSWYNLLQVNHDLASIAGYLTMSVPFLAYGLVKGMASTMTNVAQYMGGVSQSAGSQAASEAVAGNISMGVTGLRNNSAFNFSAHQQDLTARLSSGANYQLPSGDNINFMPDGSVAISRGRTISDLGVNIDFVKSVQNAATQQADLAYNTAKSESVAAGENYQAGMRDLYELANHSGKSVADGKSWVSSESASANEALNKVQDLTQQFADKHDISYSHAKNVLASAKGGLGVSAGAGSGGSGANIGANAGVDGSIQNYSTANEQKLYSYAEDFIKKSGYSESVDHIQRAAIDKTLHTSNEQGARLVESMGGSFDRASSLRKDAETHYQEAASYRNGASQLRETGIQTRTQAQQEFVEYLKKQPSVYGQGNMSAQSVLAKWQHDPRYGQMLVDGFMQGHAKNNLSNWSSNIPNSQQGIKEVYQNNANTIMDKGNQALQQQQLTNKEQVKASADKEGLLKENFIDTSAKNLAEAGIKENQQKIQQGKDKLDAIELSKEQKFKEESAAIKQHRSGVIKDALKALIVDPRKKIQDKLDE
jgi:conjugal transfer mating pair stabilization protein TraG